MHSVGFQNTGAICYFNALMGCLLNLDRFRDVASERDTDFRVFLTQKDPLFTTHLLHKYNKFLPNQSCSEYFVFMVEKLGLEHLFAYTYNVTKTCLTCQHTTRSTDKTINLLINDIAELFRTTETIANYACDHCRQRGSLLSTRELAIVPEIIALSMNKYIGKKEIGYPEFFKFSEPGMDIVYNLNSTVDHLGVLEGGHYFCRIKTPGQNFLIDDDKVYLLEALRVLPETYMVFYDRTLVPKNT